MKDSVSLSHRSEMTFDVVVNGHTIVLDASRDSGGTNQGPRPKSLLLAALAGCTAMDVVSLLNKMRVSFDDFRVSVEGNITDEHPKHYENMHVTYTIKGRDVDREKVIKAITMSQDKYCGVSYTLKQGLKITWELIMKD